MLNLCIKAELAILMVFFLLLLSVCVFARVFLASTGLPLSPLSLPALLPFLLGPSSSSCCNPFCIFSWIILPLCQRLILGDLSSPISPASLILSKTHLFPLQKKPTLPDFCVVHMHHLILIPFTKWNFLSSNPTYIFHSKAPVKMCSSLYVADFSK